MSHENVDPVDHLKHPFKHLALCIESQSVPCGFGLCGFEFDMQCVRTC